MALTTEHPHPTTEQRDPRRWWTLIVLCISLSVIGIDNTVLNVALPTLVRDLHASTASLQWIVDSYILVFAGTLLTAGSLGDRFGRKHALTTGLVIFGIGSGAAAFAPNVATLIAFRSLMGVGAALIMPATLSILTNVFLDPRERAKAIGFWAAISGMGIALGPIIGGALLRHFWWGSVFLVNAPVVIVALAAGRFLVPNSKDPSAPRLDLIGSITSIIGLSLLLYAIIEVPTKGWADRDILFSVLGAVVVLGAFVVWERTTPEPMLDVTFFENPRFTIASLSITLAFFAINGSLFVLSQHLQFVLGYSPLGAGIRMAPMALMMMSMATIAPRLNERFGSKRLVASGLTVGAIGLTILATCTEHTSYWHIAVGLVVMSAGIVCTMVPATDSIMGSLPREKAGVGSAVNDTTRQVGGALGVAVLGSLLASAYRSQLTSKIRDVHLGAGPLASARASVGGAIGTGNRAVAAAGRAAYVHGMHASLLVGALVLLGAAALALAFLPAYARDDQYVLSLEDEVDTSELALAAVAE